MKDYQNELDSLLELSEKSINKKDFRNFDSVELLEFYSNKELDLKYWKPLFVLTLLDFGFNVNSAKKLFNWGEWGHNWKILHWSKEDEELSFEKKLSKFYGEISYCSDRMSFDRLFRIHHIYNLIQYKHFKRMD